MVWDKVQEQEVQLLERQDEIVCLEVGGWELRGAVDGGLIISTVSMNFFSTSTSSGFIYVFVTFFFLIRYGSAPTFIFQKKNPRAHEVN